MIEVDQQTRVTLTLSGPDRFEWFHGPEKDGEKFVVERVTLRIENRLEQAVQLEGPWITTPARLVGKPGLSVTGWDFLGMTDHDREKMCGIPDVVLIRLGACGMDTAALPL